MREALLLCFCLAFAVSGSAQENKENRNQQLCPSRRGECAGYSSRDATSLSMMGWGLGLGVGIATLCALIPNNADSSHSH